MPAVDKTQSNDMDRKYDIHTKHYQHRHEGGDDQESDTQVRKQLPGLLPPQALLSTPPPPLPSAEDTSTLLSPWWSEEAQTESTDDFFDDATASADATSATATSSNVTAAEFTAPPLDSSSLDSNIPTQELDSNHLQDETNKDPSILNISILSFGRSAPKESKDQWKERCLLLATTTELSKKKEGVSVQNELEEIFDKSKECSMICFMRTSRELTKKPSFTLNPFYGTWISVAKTPARCKEHLLDAGEMTKKSFPDYYTMEVGDELSHSGEYVTKAVTKTFSPLQHLTQRYVDSWKDGSQQAFFSKFWSSMQKGDALYLVRDSTKRLFENALGHDKKPSDKK
ncbi:uncharacterized protein ATC70_006939 [Mucor velutinosus]|uniref:Uncharacterized protein n=1 Tax=Mucor velutinosus TaxID=708070 RepID=A0AAN7D3N3_9FUNG|nr:hypothetical protein ATC70_006939 [Mucor velutinosus]